MQRARATCGLSCNIVVLIKRVDMTIAISSQGRFPVISCWKAQARLRSEIGRGMRSAHRNNGKYQTSKQHTRQGKKETRANHHKTITSAASFIDVPGA